MKGISIHVHTPCLELLWLPNGHGVAECHVIMVAIIRSTTAGWYLASLLDSN